MIKKDIVFTCRKCEHNLFLTDAAKMMGRQIMKKLQNKHCPNCGEEPGVWRGLWGALRLGNYEEEHEED